MKKSVEGPKQRAEVMLWAIFRDAKVILLHPDPEAQEVAFARQELGRLIRAAYDLGRNTQREIDTRKRVADFKKTFDTPASRRGVKTKQPHKGRGSENA